MESKCVIQFLHDLDISGVDFGSAIEHATSLVPDGKLLRSKHHDIIAATNSIFPSTYPLHKMSRLVSLNLRDTKLSQGDLPSELANLTQLEFLSLAKNKLTRLNSFSNWSKLFPNLRVLNCRKNCLSSKDSIPSDIFNCPNLQVLDFSCNELTSVPHGIENASGLLVLNLSENKLTSVPPELFTKCTQLLLLDLSDNELTVLPSNLRPCSSLQQLILNRNPLKQYQFRPIAALKNLEVLHMAGTYRSLNNIPHELDRLQRLSDLDLSNNQLKSIPDSVFQLRSLKKLDLSHNQIDDLSNLTDNWPILQFLNLSYNQLSLLPAGLTRLTKLRKLYLNNNQLNFKAIPLGIGKLDDLEVLNLSNNLLENIPEGLCRCGRLKRLLLSSNRLTTLPDAIHFLIESLDTFDVDNNPTLKIPPKPAALKKGAGLAFYNIDFSLDAQLKLLRGQVTDPNVEAAQGKDSAARIRRMRRRRLDGGENEQGSKAVLAGMRHVANEKEAIMKKRHDEIVEEDKQTLTKRWKDALTKPNIDYSFIFDQDAGLKPGVEVWVIDEFYPKRYDTEEFDGSLLNGDCYIVLNTSQLDGVGGFHWQIFYWIGEKATLDKRACAAMHAVNLRNFLGAEGATIREEQGDESKNFLHLFGDQITVLDGAHGYTGFVHVALPEVNVKLYRLFGLEKKMHIVSMLVCPLSLDPKFIYLLDGNSKLYIWIGTQSRPLLQTRARLLAEMIAQKERLNEAEIVMINQGEESDEFWAVITGVWKPPPILNPNINTLDLPPSHAPVSTSEVAKQALEQERLAHKQKLINSHPKPPAMKPPPNPAKDFIPDDWKLPKPIIYNVKLGKGYLDLLQIDVPMNQLTKDLLDSANVLLVDSGGELFVWVGKKTEKFLRYAGFKLAEELSAIMPRGCFGGAEESIVREIIANGFQNYTRPAPQICREGSESQIFRTQFMGWEPAMAVDFTRTAQSIIERGADPNVIMERDKIRTDLGALLTPRETTHSWEDSMKLLDDLNQELVEPPEYTCDFANGSPTSAVKQFIYIDKKWEPVDFQWFGHFFNQDAYIVIANYWDYSGLSDEGSSTSLPETGGKTCEIAPSETGEDFDDEPTKTVVFFWQGRECSDLAWLTFNFSLQKDMQERLSRNPRANGRPLNVEFKRIHQQQEDIYFLAHFLRRIVIHSGRYRDRNSDKRNKAVQFYHYRMNGNPIASRCIEVLPSTTTLNSCFSYICRIPHNLIQNGLTVSSEARDQVYIWIGSKARAEDEVMLESICKQMYDPATADILTISEGEENAMFWNALGGKQEYDKAADYMNHSRLFRLSNDAGYFTASEKCTDFCQDDLKNDDVMMLDTGEQVYLWLGKRTSDVEVKLSLQAAKLYKENIERVQPNRVCQLKLTYKNAEPFPFRRCFHGWGPFYEPKDWSG